MEELEADIEESSVQALGKKDYESMKLCLKKAHNNRILLQEKKKQSAALEKDLNKLEEEVIKLWVICVNINFAFN